MHEVVTMTNLCGQDLLRALRALRKGDFSVRLSSAHSGVDGLIAEAFNDVIDLNREMMEELDRLSTVVGKEGKINQRGKLANAAGGWRASVDAVNSLISDMAHPVADVARVIGAVAKGDLSQTVVLEVDDKPLRGDFLRVGKLVNSMVAQLGSFAAEVSRVAHEVGTQGKLGGQARVKGVAGTWKDLTDNVNLMATNLTSQVRNISEVTTAVARGDLTKKVTVDVKGEILALKNTINTMVDQLSSFASEATRVAASIELRKHAEIRPAAPIERWLLEENTRIRAAKLDAEQQLRSNAARQEIIILSLPIVLYEAEAAEGGLARSFIEDNVPQLLGIDTAVLREDAMAWTTHVHPDDWPAVSKAVERIHENGDYAVQYRWKCADGAYRYFLDQGILVGGDDYDSPKVFGTMLDVHEQRQLEQQLAHAQKIEAIGQLTGGIAHDFGNMLTVVILNLDRVRRLGKLEGQVARSVDLALEGAMHCRDMVKQLLSFARQQPLTPRAFSLNHMIHDLTDLLNRTPGERVEIKKELGRDLWLVSADPTQVEASIVNLVVNARDAMPSGGAVTITTTNHYLKPNECNSLPEGPYILLQVRDTGTGMPKDVLARALEPFFTTKEASRGTGLGLSTTYGFIRQSGGDLMIDSEVGKGTTVKIFLPRHTSGESAEEPEYEASRQVPRAQGDEVILAVEDDQHVRNTTAGLLRDLGYRVLEAEDATKALEMLEKNDITLLFTDLVMPGDINGYQLATEALRRKPGIRVLYTSAHAGDRILEIAGHALQPMLRKPYRDNELARAIRDALTTP